MSEIDKSSKSQKVLKCYHCGNETLMNKTGESRWSSRDEQNDDFDFSFLYEMFTCPVCHKVTLLETYGDESMQRYDYRGEVEWYKEEKILFPINSLDSNAIPKPIKAAFEATIKSRNIDTNVCLMSLRRTLELILVDKGATKWGLKDKIEEIASKGILPETLKEASSLAKKLGDSAAHGKEIDIEADSHDVNSLIEFVEYIIEYLYVLPYKMDRFKKRMNEAENPEMN